MRIGINGLGRIGRIVLRQLWASGSDEVVHVNDSHMTLEHAAYLIKYDSVYGRFPGEADARPGGLELRDANRHWTITLTTDTSAALVPWADYGVDLLVEASGVASNASACRTVVALDVQFAVITQLSEFADATVVFGANEDDALAASPAVVATNTCDAVAIAPVLRALGDLEPIESASLITLHPWLGYQNLTDGPVRGVAAATPHFADMALGRSAVGAVIPKQTTAARCVEAVLPSLAGRLSGMSYRVPTASVCYCDLTVRFQDNVAAADVAHLLSTGSPYVRLSTEPLVSVDLIGDPASAVVDRRFIGQVDRRAVRLSLGYDNEWGFAGRVNDLIAHLRKAMKGNQTL